MKKRIAIVIGLLFTLCLTGCNSSEYQEATEKLNNGEYEEALIIFEELAEANYNDSEEMIKKTKYQYVQANYNNDDETTYQYLQSLVECGYSDSQELYNDLYDWKAKIWFSDMENSLEEVPTVNASNKLFPFYDIMFLISGGTPGAEYRGEYEITYSNGVTEREGYVGSDRELTLKITCSATQTPLGKTTFTLYDENGNVLQSRSAIIK